MAFATVEMSRSASDSREDSKIFNMNPKSFDYKFMGKKDEHRFGVELEEFKQFHHTKTGPIISVRN